MTGIRLSWPAVAAAAMVFVLLGVGGAYLWMPRPGVTAPTNVGVGSDAPTTGTGSAPLPDVFIDLPEEAIAKAGIVVTPVTVSDATGTIRLSGIVQPNAYGEVVVAPLVSGRVTRVAVTLGERVSRNAPLVEIYSPDLAEVQTRYVSMRAEFQAVEQQIARTERLVQIGAASQQELERIHAEHVRHRTEVESARTRLQLLGMTPQQIEALTSSGQVAATTTVVSPIAGVVTARTANPGTSVDAATPLVTVVDLSTVWIVADLYRARLLAGLRWDGGDGDYDGVSGPENHRQGRVHRSASEKRDAHGEDSHRGRESGAAAETRDVRRCPGRDATDDDTVRAGPAIIGSEPRRSHGGVPLRSPCAGPIHRAGSALGFSVGRPRCGIGWCKAWRLRGHVRQLFASSRTGTPGAQGTAVTASHLP